AAPAAMATDHSNNIFVTNGDSVVRKVSTSGTVTVIAGGGAPAGFGGDGGPATLAQFNYISGIAIDDAGNIFISDFFKHRIRKVAANGIVSTVEGSEMFGYGGDGLPATSAKLYLPSDIGLDASGNLYIADTSNNRIRKLSDASRPTAFSITNRGGLSLLTS